jgi:hypothetical protein
MDNDKTIIDDFVTQMKLGELDRTIRYARLRCLSLDEIVDRIARLDEGDSKTDYVHRLSEMELTDSELERLVDAMDLLAQRSENAPSKLKLKLDRTLLRLVRLLPSDLANRFAEPFVDHRRKARRRWAYAALRQKQISQAIAAKLLKVFHETGDQDALQLIARNPERVPEIGAEVLMESLDEEYWRARVVEALLLHDRQSALSLCDQYPFEFAHAAGRVEDTSLLDPLCELLDDNRDDLEFLSIYAYALGKLRGKDELESLEEYIASAYDDIRDKCEMRVR